MSSATRRRIAAFGLALLALWPIAHHLLAQRLEFDPWIHFGWSMYALPSMGVQVQVAEVRGDRFGDLKLTELDHQNILTFQRHRQHFGRLIPPEILARTLMASHPDVQQLQVRIRRWVLDPETARIDVRDRDRVYTRE